MSLDPDRRTVVGALAATLAVGGRSSAAAEPLFRVLNPPVGPPMACAGVIARRPDSTVALRAVGGVAGAQAFTLDRPFRVASVSKMVATSVFLPMALSSGLDLDADASDLVGFRLRHPAYAQVPITPRMLLSHTSGLRNGPSIPCPWATGSPKPSRRVGGIMTAAPGSGRRSTRPAPGSPMRT